MSALVAPSLASREGPPMMTDTMADTTMPPMDTTYTGNVGNDMGIHTAGYRVNKYNISEWNETNYGKYYQSFADRDNAEKVRFDAKRALKESVAQTDKTQAETTKKLAERVQDITFWKAELEKEIGDMIDETDKLLGQKKRLENALRASEVPLHIATDNLNCRQRRQGVDLVQDDPELALLKEVEVINNVQDLLKKTIKESDAQIKRNRDRKQELEMDWSDKKEAKEIDTKCAVLRNEHTNKQFFAGAARFQEIQSTPESWAQFSHDNITRAEHERMASIQLRALIDNVLVDTSRDMGEQNNMVNQALATRVNQMQDAKDKLEDNLKKVVGDIGQTEKLIDDLKNAIKDKEDPMKVAQTRLHLREARPNVELCRDPVQYSLVNEVHEISQYVDEIMQRLSNAEHALKDLQDARMSLEKEISIKTNSIFIDKDKCMTHRTRYPTATKLQGYQ